jgi:hypothetical protein
MQPDARKSSVKTFRAVSRTFHVGTSKVRWLRRFLLRDTQLGMITVFPLRMRFTLTRIVSHILVRVGWSVCTQTESFQLPIKLCKAVAESASSLPQERLRSGTADFIQSEGNAYVISNP